MTAPHTRRDFLTLATCALAGNALRAQTPLLAHASVAEMERPRILAEAKSALTAPIAPVTSFAAPTPRPNQFFSEIEPDIRTAGGRDAPKLFRTQARALRTFSSTVASLSAAYLLTADAQYIQRAAEHIRANLLTPATRLDPAFDTAGCAPGTTTATPAGAVDLVPLAELARALTFLVDAQAFAPAEWDAIQTWFKSANDWLNTAKPALIASDTKDHRASAWLLLTSAFTRFTRDETGLEACRTRFRSSTLRHQLRSDGVFPQEVATPNPFRNTLFNFDLLAGACQLLSSPFDPLWTYELIDGVGMRILAAFLYPFIEHPERWPFVADEVGFRDLPGRRPALLFAGRAFSRPEYVALWQQLPGGPPLPRVAGSFPIRQPILWTTKAPHGL